MGLLVTAISMKGILRYIFNSGCRGTERFMRVLGRETAAMRIKNSKLIIEMLETELSEPLRKENIQNPYTIVEVKQEKK